MSPKCYRLMFASHSSTASPLGFSKGNLDLYEGKYVGDKNRSFTINSAVVAMVEWENRGLLI